MIWIVALVAIQLPTSLPPTKAEVQNVQVSARILRGGEASARSAALHHRDRVRRVVETRPDGKKLDLIILDFE